MRQRLVPSTMPVVRGTEEMTSSWDSGDSDSVLDIFRLSEPALELVAQVVELPSLEVFKWPLEMALCDTA